MFLIGLITGIVLTATVVVLFACVRVNDEDDE